MARTQHSAAKINLSMPKDQQSLEAISCRATSAFQRMRKLSKKDRDLMVSVRMRADHSSGLDASNAVREAVEAGCAHIKMLV